MSTSSIAVVENLSVVARTNGHVVPIVDDVSFELLPGTMCALVGETGSGKTLTSKALLGILPGGLTASGRFHLEGAPSTDLSASHDQHAGRLVRELGVVLQNPVGMFNPVMRVGKQLTEAVIEHGLMDKATARQRAVELLKATGFTDVDRVLRLYPHQLSGGMAQRAAIAMALMPRPQLLVVDEPTSALDATLRTEVLALLERCAQEEGSSVLLISHDLELVGKFCRTTVVMYAGHVVEAGPTDVVLADPQHPYTQALLATAATVMSHPRAKLSSIPGAPPEPGDWPSGCVFHPRCPLAYDRCFVEVPQPRVEHRREAACHVAFEH